MVSYLSFLYQWVLKRLPKSFSIPLVILLVLYFAFVFPFLAVEFVPRAEDWISRQVPKFTIPRPALLHIPKDYSVVGGIVSAMLIILIAALGILVSYGIAATLYRIIRGKPMKRLKLREPAPLPAASEASSNPLNPLAKYERIGIILAGGGAKGAYQAGAMQAIYEFLEQHNALHKVRMIAGTSIGSWNSLFWLAGLVKKPDANTRSVLEQWWHEVDVKSVIRFALYLPLRQNYLLSPEPWQETFARIFKNDPKISERLLHHIQHQAPAGNHSECADAMHFYLTRANVALGNLEFTTNRDDLSEVDPNLPVGVRPHQKARPDSWKRAQTIDDLHDAVFASMDIPPLFKNVVIDDELFEDGGVIDNLPIRFGTEFENCDLLFILPLNASFAQKPDQRSIVKRLFRVIDVRQGVLERNSFKMVYLYNELAALRNEAGKNEDAARRYEAALRAINNELQTGGLDMNSVGQIIRDALDTTPATDGLPSTPSATATGAAASATQRALSRRHKVVQVFSICPAPELLINTAEFWKTEEAGKAFRLMFRKTKDELHQFFSRVKPSPDWIRMARVGPQGEVTYLEDF